MFSINFKLCAMLCATLLATALGQQRTVADADAVEDNFSKPWPTYSLQNMPKTRFSCHDKILGGYYADAETQCQMFHVCVKLAGIGVQDYRFLCPNGTAFDQELQICANWADVDCSQTLLYYGSDNFDLYRIGSGFESKRAPLAEEEEATFHLQRAESADIRRSKETRIDQKSRPEQPPNYGKQFDATPRNNYAKTHVKQDTSSNSNSNTNSNIIYKTPTSKKPIVSYYTPTTTTSTERYNDDSKQDFDDIFKGSHSSHFFANRNGGREDDFVDHPPLKTHHNDINEYNRKPAGEQQQQAHKSRVSTNRGQRLPAATSTTTATTKPTATTTKPTSATLKPTKKITLHAASYNTDLYDYAHYFKTTPTTATAKPTPKTTATTTTTTTTTPRSTYSNANRFVINFNDYQTQEKIQPTTYNPNSGNYRLLKITTPKPSDYAKTSKDYEKAKPLQKTTVSSVRKQPAHKHKLGPQESNYVNHNEFSEFSKLKLQQPQPFQSAAVLPALGKPTQLNATKQAPGEPQYQRARAGQTLRVGSQEPAPFSAPTAVSKLRGDQQQQQQRSRSHGIAAAPTPTAAYASPRAFTSRGSITYKATTQRNAAGESYTASTGNAKKFSTLVPKELYTPTTFKPTTYKKTYEQNFYQTPRSLLQKPTTRTSSSGTSSTTPSSLANTANPYYEPYINPEEDDGQYRPELYEVDFPRNRPVHRLRSTTVPPSPVAGSGSSTAKPTHAFQHAQSHLKTQQQTSYQKEKEQAQSTADVSDDEDELFNTAQSLNFGAASINKLRADIYKAEKTSQQYNSQYSPNLPVATNGSTTHSYAPFASSAFSTTSRPFSTTYLTTPTTTTTTTTTSKTTSTPTTTKRPTTTTTTTKRPTTITTPTTPTTYYAASNYKSYSNSEPKAVKPTKSNSKKESKKDKKIKTKRPAHADEDTSYDYAYYDSDTLSESPQEYPEYEIKEFVKTRKN